MKVCPSALGFCLILMYHSSLALISFLPTLFQFFFQSLSSKCEETGLNASVLVGVTSMSSVRSWAKPQSFPLVY